MKTPIRELKRRARAVLTGQYALPMGAFALSQLLILFFNVPFELTFQSNPTTFQAAVFGLATFIISLLSSVLTGGQAYIHLNIARGRQSAATDVFRFFNRRPDRFILSGLFLTGISLPVLLPAAALTALALQAGILPLYAAACFAWCVTLIPLLWISCTYGLNLYLLTEYPSESLADIFKTSRRLMQGNKWRLFCLGLSFAGLLLLSVLSLGIGLLWVIPYRNQAFTELYLDISKKDRTA